jgi:hypothetical protein
MKRISFDGILLFLIGWLIVSFGFFAQLTSSTLPIVVICTNTEIPDEPKVLGQMGVIWNGDGKSNHRPTRPI